jgi:hypothetical protein
MIRSDPLICNPRANAEVIRPAGSSIKTFDRISALLESPLLHEHNLVGITDENLAGLIASLRKSYATAVTEQKAWEGKEENDFALSDGWTLLDAIPMPDSGLHRCGRSVMTSLGSCDVTERVRYMFGVKAHAGYALLKSSHREYENGQETGDYHSDAPYTVVTAPSPSELILAVLELAYRQARGAFLVSALGRDDFGTNVWRAEFAELFQGRDAPLRYTGSGRVALCRASACEMGLAEELRSGDYVLRPQAAGVWHRDYPGDPGYFSKSPLFIETNEPLDRHVVQGADGKHYRLHPELHLAGLTARHESLRAEPPPTVLEFEVTHTAWPSECVGVHA